MSDQPAWQQIPPSQQPPKKRRRRWPWIGLGILVLLVIVIATTSNGSKTPTTTTGNSGSTTTVTPQQAAQVAPTAAPAAPAPTTAAPTVLYSKSGSGAGSTPNFTTGAEWQVDWTYNCSNFGSQGNFIISAGNAADISFPSVNELGTSGADTAYVHSDPGSHSLSINSECSWTVKVVG